MKKSSSLPGIKDIAVMAGVSIGTVDRALHNRGRVSQATRNRVREIAEKLNYKPNMIARSLVAGKERTIALLIPDQKEEFWKQAWESVSAVMEKWKQYRIFIESSFYSAGDRSSFEKASVEIMKKKPDGVVMASVFHDEGKKFYEHCIAASIPMVMFDSAVPGAKPLSIIGIDSFQSGMAAAELLHMTARKKGRFILLHFDDEAKNSPHIQEKERGFLEYLKKECPERKYKIVVLNKPEQQYHQQLEEVFKKWKLSGIYVTTSMAYHVGAFISKMNNNKVRVVGYDLTADNVRFMKSGHIDFLINQNPGRQAEESINTLCGYLVQGDEVVPRKLFPAEIVIRTSLDSFLKSVN